MATELVNKESAENGSTMPPHQSNGVVILGMHRSGTSAVASLLSGLGFHSGNDPLPPQPDNPLGYFEDKRIVAAHDRFLTACGTTWSDPRPLPNDCFSGPAAEEAKSAIEDLLEQEFMRHPRWVIKDPRACRLLPLWDSPLEHHNAQHGISYLHVLRSPRSVAGSLARRDDFRHSRGALLWLRHYLESELVTRGRNRAWISFEDLTSDGYTALETPLTRLFSDQAIDLSNLDKLFEESFEEKLVHQASGGKVVPPLFHHPWLVRTEEALSLLTNNESQQAFDALDSIREELTKADTLFFDGEGFWETELQQERYSLVSRQVEQTNYLIEHLGTLLSDVTLKVQQREDQQHHQAERLLATQEEIKSQVVDFTETTRQLSEEAVESLSALSDSHQKVVEDLTSVRPLIEDTLTELHQEVGSANRLSEALALARRLEGEAAAATTRWERTAQELDDFKAQNLSAQFKHRQRAVELEELEHEILSLKEQRVLIESEMADLRKGNQVLIRATDSAKGLAEKCLKQEQETQARHQLAEEEILILKSSLSWRIMAPLRKIRSWFS